jgi:hypothetical protein
MLGGAFTLRYILISALTVSSVFALSATAHAQASQKQSEPSYTDTLHYIQERLQGGLEEVKHCEFTHHHPGTDYDYKFDFSDLSPHVSWGKANDGSINCAGGKGCVQQVVRAGESAPNGTEWRFSIKQDSDQKKVERALLHLLDLCGVRAAKPDLF